jgi:hypothetical protein
LSKILSLFRIVTLANVDARSHVARMRPITTIEIERPPNSDEATNAWMSWLPRRSERRSSRLLMRRVVHTPRSATIAASSAGP